MALTDWVFLGFGNTAVSTIHAISLRAQAAQNAANRDAATSAASRLSAGVTGKKDTAQKFESFVLQSFVQEMLPKDMESVYGGGIAGDYWRQMLAERLGEVMAETGSIGIADIVRKSVKLKEAAANSFPIASQVSAQSASGALISNQSASAIAALGGSTTDGE